MRLYESGMKKGYKVLLAIIIILSIIIIAGSYNPLLFRIAKPFSEPCGFSGTFGGQAECKCDGLQTVDMRKGSTTFYCTGTCSECKCYSVDYPSYTKTEIDCANFSKIDWGFLPGWFSK